MYCGYSVTAVVPAGRRRYLEILLPYLRAQRSLIDVCHLWCNTTIEEDIDYIHSAARGDGFIQVISPTIPVRDCWSIHHFFKTCVDSGRVYIRFDDDICWMADDAVERLLAFRLAHPEFFLVYANIVNNSICSHLHQKMGRFDTSAGLCEYDVIGAVSHASPVLAKLAHESFLSHLEAGTTSEYLFPQWIALAHERISINCISWFGSDFAAFGGAVGDNEEVWLTQDRPRSERRYTAICGTALMAHFAYYTQRPWLEANTDLLERYRAIAGRRFGLDSDMRSSP